jgi:hypothetical protein
MSFIIKDWANNVCFKGQTFPSFEDAWGFIYENDPAPSDAEAESGWFDDYYVEETKS